MELRTDFKSHSCRVQRERGERERREREARERETRDYEPFGLHNQQTHQAMLIETITAAGSLIQAVSYNPMLIRSDVMRSLSSEPQVFAWVSEDSDHSEHTSRNPQTLNPKC